MQNSFIHYSHLQSFVYLNNIHIDHKAKKVLYNYDNYNRLTSKEVVLSDNSKFTDSVTYKNNYSEEVEKYSSDLVYNYSTVHFSTWDS